MSSRGNTSSKPQVSALVPRPVVNGMWRMCQRHGSDQTPALLFESKNHVDIRVWASNYIPRKTRGVVTYSFPNLSCGMKSEVTRLNSIRKLDDDEIFHSGHKATFHCSKYIVVYISNRKLCYADRLNAYPGADLSIDHTISIWQHFLDSANYWALQKSLYFLYLIRFQPNQHRKSMADCDHWTCGKETNLTSKEDGFIYLCCYCMSIHTNAIQL